MGPGEFLNINFFTALFTLVNTIILYLLLRHFLFQPVMKIIADRQQEIDDMYAEADSTQASARALKQQYTQQLAAATQTGATIVQEAVLRGQALEKEILRTANAEAAAIMGKAATEIAQEKKKAIHDVKDQISVIAISIAEKVLAHTLSNADQQQLVDEFIRGLDSEI